MKIKELIERQHKINKGIETHINLLADAINSLRDFQKFQYLINIFIFIMLIVIFVLVVKG